MPQTYIILASKWFTSNYACIGVVAIKSNEHEPDDVLEWKVFLGNGAGYSQKDDEQHVAAWGNALSPEEAAGFFPWLDVTKYKKE